MRWELVCHRDVNILQQVIAIFVEQGVKLNGFEVDDTKHIFLTSQKVTTHKLEKIKSKLHLISAITDVNIVQLESSQQNINNAQTLIKQLPFPFIVIDVKGKITQVNEMFLSTFGGSSEQLIGKCASDILKGFNFNLWLEDPQTLVDSENSSEAIFQTRSKTVRVMLKNEVYAADISPVYEKKINHLATNILSGALIRLTSANHLAQQANILKLHIENDFSSIHATSSIMLKVVREAKRMALLDSSILISGETGTGKEVLAHACHKASERSNNPFMTLSCAALPDDVAETELFGLGHQNKDYCKKGLFESANGGTIFLDEVGEMSPKLQAKLLRVIQDGSFRRVDDEKEIKVNVRVIGSTNRDLLQMVDKGQFREDLYYRLNVLGIKIPALRERRLDIIPLAEYFVAKSGLKIGKTNILITDACREFIKHYSWPGNIRQLENVLIRAVSLMEGNNMTTEYIDLPKYTPEQGYSTADFEGTLDAYLKKHEAGLLKQLYPAYPSSRQLAKKLGVSHTAIANKLREYDINKNSIKI